MYLWIVILMIFGLCFLNRIKLKNHQGIVTQPGRKFYIFIMGTILIALCGLRRPDIGIDTPMYHYLFIQAGFYDHISSYLYGYKYIEYAYYALNYFAAHLAGFQVFLIICAVLSIAPAMFVIYKYSKNPAFSLFLYVAFNYFTFCMTGMRQAIAIGIILMAYHFMKQKKLAGFLICIVLACLFHSSALIFLPVYWISKIPFNKLTISLSSAGIILAYILKSPLYKIAVHFSRQDYLGNDAGGTKMYLFMLLTVLLGFLLSKRMSVYESDEKGNAVVEDNKILLYLMVLAAMVWPVASVNSALFRMYYYYHIFIILFVPVMLQSIKAKPVKFLIGSGYFGIGIYFIITQILPASMRVNPYCFFWK